MEESKSELRFLRIHGTYIIGILIAIIIFIATVRWGADVQVVQYVSFALTVTSIVLSVLAIIYAFLSNAAISTGVADVQRAAHLASRSATDIVSSTEELKNHIAEIPASVGRVDAKLSATHDMVARLAAQPVTAKATDQTHGMNEKDALTFVGSSSYLGIVAMYFAVKACDVKKTVSIPADFLALKVGDASYLHGYWVAMASCGLITSEVNTNGETTVVAVHQVLIQRAASTLRERWKSKGWTVGMTADQTIANIDAYLTVHSTPTPTA